MDVRTMIRFLNDTDVGADILHSLGLERRRSAVGGFVGSLGIFIAGALVGAGVGLLLAPTTGDEMRVKARASIDEWRNRLMQFGERLQGRAEELRGTGSDIGAGTGTEPYSAP